MSCNAATCSMYQGPFHSQRCSNSEALSNRMQLSEKWTRLNQQLRSLAYFKHQVYTCPSFARVSCITDMFCHRCHCYLQPTHSIPVSTAASMHFLLETLTFRCLWLPMCCDALSVQVERWVRKHPGGAREWQSRRYVCVCFHPVMQFIPHEYFQH